MPKAVQNTIENAILISHANQVMLQILQAKLQQMVYWELLDIWAEFWSIWGTKEAE